MRAFGSLWFISVFNAGERQGYGMETQAECSQGVQLCLNGCQGEVTSNRFPGDDLKTSL